MILYAIRHGQTDLNKEHILQGNSIDEPLNSVGINEINNLLPSLPEFEVIYCSIHKRVKESAEIISAFSDKPIIINTNIEERDFGSLTGKQWADIPDGEKLHETDRKLEYDYRPYGGESVYDVTNRVNQFLNEIIDSGHDTALVVTSRGVIQLMYKILENKMVIDIENAFIHRFIVK